MSNVMAVLLQTLSAQLGIVTGHDLAQACRAEYSRPVNVTLWLLAEVAIAACDLAEVLGTVIALNLLFGLPLLWGCLVTAFDTVLLLAIQRLGIRKMEAFIFTLVGTIGTCFLVQMFLARPDARSLLTGFRPTLPPGALFVAIGILGATVMPHNLYLHSALVQTRRFGGDRGSKERACRYNLIDTAIALNAAFFINAAILVLSAAVFHKNTLEVASIEEAYRLLPSFLGEAAPILFGIALLCAGQSSTITGTLAGQIIMEGYLHLRIAPWLRRLVTRMLALIPAVMVIALAGESSTQGPDRPEPGDSQPTTILRGDPANPLHVESEEHGVVRDAVVGSDPGLAHGRDHRGAECQTGARNRQQLGRDGSRVGVADRTRASVLARRVGLVWSCRGRGLPAGLGNDQALGPSCAAVEA